MKDVRVMRVLGAFLLGGGVDNRLTSSRAAAAAAAAAAKSLQSCPTL